MIALTLFLMRDKTPSDVQPSLLLVPWHYGDSNYIFLSMDNASGYAKKYLEALTMKDHGIGTRCSKHPPSSSEFPCKPVTLKDASLSSTTGSCRCEGNQSKYNCSMSNMAQPFSTPGDYLINATNSNITEWLLVTATEFRKKRYGGITSGKVNSMFVDGVNWSTVEHNINGLIEKLQNFSNASGISWPSPTPTSPTPKPNPSFLTPLNNSELLQLVLNGAKIQNNIKIWFDDQGWISLPVYANVLSNAALRANFPQKAADYGIIVYNHPMRLGRAGLTRATLGERIVETILETLLYIFAFGMIPASFVLFVILEERTFSKHLQFVSGVRPLLYWLSNYTWDMINFLITITACMIVFFVFKVEAFVGWPGTTLGTFSLLLLYSWAIIPLMYLFAFLFRIPSLVFVVLMFFNTLVGVTVTMLSMMVDNMEPRHPWLATPFWRHFFLLFPHCGLGLERDDLKNPFIWKFLGKKLFFLFLDGCIYFGLVLLIEYYRRCSLRCKGGKVVLDPNEDEDVRRERERMNSGQSTESYALVIKNLTKQFRGCCSCVVTKAVDNLSVGVKTGECFGLLGVNGAGKTTTFSMLVGKESVTSGDAFINGASILTQMDQVSRQIGFCPQFDALHGLLTGREELRLYGRLKGVKNEYLEKVVSRLIDLMGLKAFADRQTGTYSGGNKRKLSTAIALIGSPVIVLLDEPTTGMDPKAKRFVWGRIRELVQDGKTSVILTSHSMEECEALCGRIGIMVRGRFRCLGSNQHLKSRFGQGYTLTMKLGGVKPKTAEAIEFVTTRLPGAELKEQHLNQVRFELCPTSSPV